MARLMLPPGDSFCDRYGQLLRGKPYFLKFNLKHHKNSACPTLSQHIHWTFKDRSVSDPMSKIFIELTFKKKATTEQTKVNEIYAKRFPAPYPVRWGLVL